MTHSTRPSLSFALTLLLSAAALPCQAEEDWSDLRTVAVTGTSVARVAPDLVNWNLTITDYDPQLSRARQQTDQRVEQVLSLRGTLGIEPADIQTSYLNIDKIYERDRQGNQGEFRHYRVIRTMTIRQRDVKRFDELLQALSGVENLEISYSLASSKFHELRAETRLEAVKAARAKAEAMTEALGAGLGRVLQIDERHRPSPMSNPMSNSMFYAGEPAQADDIRGSFAPGAIEIRVSLDARFEIVPK